MNINDWFELPIRENIHMFSANGVPWPLDEWLKLQGKMTTYEAAEILKRWGNK